MNCLTCSIELGPNNTSGYCRPCRSKHYLKKGFFVCSACKLIPTKSLSGKCVRCKRNDEIERRAASRKLFAKIITSARKPKPRVPKRPNDFMLEWRMRKDERDRRLKKLR